MLVDLSQSVLLRQRLCLVNDNNVMEESRMWGDRMMSWGTGWNGWLAAWPIHVLWVLLLIAGVVLLLRRQPVSAQQRHRRVGEDRAVAILRERYAHGEIVESEFEEQMRRIRESREPSR
jgi:putative membrane protein